MFGADDGQTLQRLASQASVALENARLHQSLQSLSLTDPLTGLPNRRHLSVHLEHEMAAAKRGRELLAVIFDLAAVRQAMRCMGIETMEQYQAHDRMLADLSI